jgi:hypothetical protein
MSTPPLSSILSPQQLAIVQQARATLTRPAASAAPPRAAAVVPAQTQAAPPSRPTGGRGQIIDVTA